MVEKKHRFLEWTRQLNGCLSHTVKHSGKKYRCRQIKEIQSYRNVILGSSQKYISTYSFLAYTTRPNAFFAHLSLGQKQSLKISPQSNPHNFDLCIFCNCIYLSLLEFPFLSSFRRPTSLNEWASVWWAICGRPEEFWFISTAQPNWRTDSPDCSVAMINAP